jgi:hypothetical protein
MRTCTLHAYRTHPPRSPTCSCETDSSPSPSPSTVTVDTTQTCATGPRYQPVPPEPVKLCPSLFSEPEFEPRAPPSILPKCPGLGLRCTLQRIIRDDILHICFEVGFKPLRPGPSRPRAWRRSRHASSLRGIVSILFVRVSQPCQCAQLQPLSVGPGSRRTHGDVDSVPAHSCQHISLWPFCTVSRAPPRLDSTHQK